MARYGLPYQGSKNGIAKWVVDNLPPAETFVDLFAGGCAITHCAMTSNKYERYIANDISPYPQIFKDAINGKYRDFEKVPTREEFFESDDPVIKLLYSFGNKGSSYLWANEIEPIKVNASRMVVSKDPKTRRLYYKKFMYALYEYIEQNAKCVGCDKKHAGDLQGLEGLERLQVYHSDYQAVSLPPNATIYCDPPYRGTTKYGKQEFDFERFDKWLEDVNRLIIVSEYTAPKNCVKIAEIQKAKLMNGKGQDGEVTEGLFVHKKNLEEYKERMKQGKTPSLFE